MKVIKGSSFLPISIFLALAASQAVPTFGSQLGFAGNYLPIFVGILLSLPALLIVIGSKSLSVSRQQYLFIFILLVAFPFVVFLGHLLTGPTTQTFIDIAKSVLFVYFFLIGVLFCRLNNQGGERLVFFIIAIALLVNIILFVFFMINTNSAVLGLYRTRVIGGLAIGNARFSGAWNFPYNMTVFLVAFFVVTIVVAFSSFSGNLKRLFALGCAVLIVMMVSLAQSRTALVSLLIVPLLVFFIYSVKSRHSLALNSKAILRLLTMAIVICIPVLIFSSNILDAFEHYVARIYNRALDDGFSGLVSSQRFERFDRLFDGIEDSPLGLLFGFSRDSIAFSGDPYESFMDYFVRFGIIGGSIFFLMPIFYACSISVFSMKNLTGFGFLISVFLLSFSISVVLHFSTTIMYHYRFIPLFFFVLGFLSERIRHISMRH